jgi:translation initiation factor IF-3
MKDVRFGPNTDKHDFDFKVNHATKFLQDGNKVKAYVHFHGRSIVYKDRGEKMLLEFAQSLEEVGKIEMMPKMEGKRMFVILTPKLVVGKKPAKKAE